MAVRKNRYLQMRNTMTYILLADLAVFIIYLIAAALGEIGLKTLTSIITILTSALSLGYLYLTREIFKKRSLWITVAAGAILICVLYSLLLSFFLQGFSFHQISAKYRPILPNSSY